MDSELCSAGGQHVLVIVKDSNKQCVRVSCSRCDFLIEQTVIEICIQTVPEGLQVDFGLGASVLVQSMAMSEGDEHGHGQ